MEPTHQPEDAERTPSTRPKRSRTGCLTCRTRRRKCDEEKPKCQNCISKGLECQYPAAFQFLGKNNFTPEVTTKAKYTTLRFVSEDGATQPDKDHETDDSEESAQEECSIEMPSRPATEQSGTEETVSQQLESASLRKSPPADNYEFALHGLLALGNSNAGAMNAEVHFSPSDLRMGDGLPTGTTQVEGSRLGIFAQVDFGEERAGQAAQGSNWHLADMPANEALDALPEEYHLELLKHYRYEIAPWLDICDMSQTFGGEVLQLSTDSNAIRYGLLALAETSRQAREGYRRREDARNIALLADTCQQRHMLSVVHQALLEILGTLRNMVGNLDTFWMKKSQAAAGEDAVRSLIPEISDNSLTSCVYWLWVRIQLGLSLVNSTPLRIALPFVPSATETYFGAMKAQEVWQCANHAVALCVDAVMFCHGDQDEWTEQRYGHGRAEAWNQLARGLEGWYLRRPQDFQAIIELYPKDGRSSEDEFPTLVFTGGAAILANQLCHTGMLLLLQNKPRFSTHKSMNSSFMATLWHARRICGIAASNDRMECWDPCLIASLLFAARTATHQSQHTVIVNVIQRIQKLTGWNVSQNLVNLREEWRLAEGW